MYIVRKINQNSKKKYTNDDIRFLIWMSLIEQKVYDKIQFTLDEIPDEPYRDMFDEELDYGTVAKNIINKFKSEIYNL